MLEQTMKTLRDILRPDKLDPKNKYRHSSHVILVSSKEKNDYALCLEEQIDLASAHLIADENVESFTIIPLGRNVITFNREN